MPDSPRGRGEIRELTTIGTWNRVSYGLGVWMPTRLRAARILRQRALRRLR